MVNKKPSRNVLVIGDLHAPFTLPGYLDFCKNVYKKYKCNHVLFIGDGIDNSAASYHESSPDGMSAGLELQTAIEQLAPWHKTFKNADYIIGNHCAIIARKLRTAGLPKAWSKSFGEVLGLQTWKFHTRLEIDGVLYTHGEGATAKTKCLKTGQSVVQGHRHTEGYVWHYQMGDKTTFGMQVGTGIDKNAYAFEYAKDHPDPVLGCGVVINGKNALFIPMDV